MTNYTPRAGSYAEKVINHLRQHGGVMHSAQITKLFGCKSGNIHHNLHAALGNRLIVREGQGASTIYRLPGEGDAAWTPATDDQAQTQEDAKALDVVIYSDGDVLVKGHRVVADDEYTAIFSQAQMEQLVARVTRPLVQVVAC